MNILFIGIKQNKNTGGFICDKMNKDLVANISSYSSCYQIEFNSSKFSRALNGLIGNYYSINDEIVEITNIINKNKIKYVFISTSLLGWLAKKLKETFSEIKIITFYHNVEAKYSFERLRLEPFKIYNYILFVNSFFAEKLAVKNSHYNITMNERDKLNIRKIYKREIDLILPFCINDEWDKSIKKITNEIKILFVGSSFFANLEGIEWFCIQVLPYVKCKLTIVGNGFEREKNNKKLLNAEIIGKVDDLSIYYNESDLVIAPIFSGSGMKTKIAEALMHSRPVIGSKEAFTGYLDSVNNQDSPLIECNTKEEFIFEINKLICDFSKIKILWQNSRKLYEEKYSNTANESKIREFLLKKF